MKDGLASEKLGNWGNHLLLKTRREASSGRAELHEKQSELIIVQSGHATIIGGKILNGQITAPCAEVPMAVSRSTAGHPETQRRTSYPDHEERTVGRGGNRNSHRWRCAPPAASIRV